MGKNNSQKSCWEKLRERQQTRTKRNSTPELPTLRKGYLNCNTQQAALALGMERKTFQNRLAPNAKNPLDIKIKRVGRRIYIPLKELERYAETEKE